MEDEAAGDSLIDGQEAGGGRGGRRRKKEALSQRRGWRRTAGGCGWSPLWPRRRSRCLAKSLRRCWSATAICCADIGDGGKKTKRIHEDASPRHKRIWNLGKCVTFFAQFLMFPDFSRKKILLCKFFPLNYQHPKMFCKPLIKMCVSILCLPSYLLELR